MLKTISLDLQELNDGEPLHLTIPEILAGERIDRAIARIIPELSRSRIINWIKSAHILINNKICMPKDKVFGGEQILIYPQISNEELAFTPEDIPLNVVYEDEQVLVINKPAKLTVHPGNGNWNGTLLNGLLYHYPQLQHIPRAGIVHRLDKDTSGLMVVAKTLLAQTSLVLQLQNRSVSRIYRAIVTGHTTKSGCVNKNIGRDPSNRIKMAALEIGGREAITNYRTLEYFDDFSYIECSLETGRTHQIRVHMKSINHPIIGDSVYGKAKTNYPKEILQALNTVERQCLHALKLSFIHPQTKQKVEFKCDLANDIESFLHTLRQHKNLNLDDDFDDFDNDEVEVHYVK